MNLSILERMAREGDASVDALRYLLGCKAECEYLDFKEAINLSNDNSLCEFAKDVLAIKNIGGGYIVVGVKDRTWAPIGLNNPLPYDSKELRDKMQKAAGVDIDIDIVQHEIAIANALRRFALIFVRGRHKRNKRRSPTLVGKDFNATSPNGLRRGEIYVRRGDSTIKLHTESELRDLLDNLEYQSDQDALDAAGKTSPFAVEDGLYHLLEKGFEQFIGRTTVRERLLEAITHDPRIWIVNVHGPGGVGKSALVTWAVYELYRKRTFECIIQLTAKDAALTPTGIEIRGRSLYSLENLLDHILFAFDETPPQELEQKLKLVNEYLSAWSTLLVLDNMETVQDGRILNFVQNLPQESKTKVLLTSRQKTGGWELPFPLNELDISEVQEFLKIRCGELGLDFPTDIKTAQRVWQATGGLPLAIQWLLGRYRVIRNFESVITEVTKDDSPVLEFSFRNIWNVLSSDAKTILAVLSIFDEPPTVQHIAISLDYPLERIEKAITELSEVTLVTKYTQSSDGRTTVSALPITLSFARHQLGDMGDLEQRCRQRYRRFSDQIKLHDFELQRFQSKFIKYGLESDNEKRAAILCQRGESEMFVGNMDSADALFKQARELAPRSAYVYALSASYEVNRGHIGQAMEFIDEACRRANKRTGALCYTIKGRIMDVQHDKIGRAAALERAMEYDPDDNVIRHQYGVALSRRGKTEEAISQFTMIIEKEKDREPPSMQMLMALKTRMLNLKRLSRTDDLARDVALTKEIFKKYSHLSSEAQHFAEFLDATNPP